MSSSGRPNDETHPKPVVASEYPLPSPGSDSSDVMVLRHAVTRLELRQSHLQKDLVVKDAYLATLRAELLAMERELTVLREAADMLNQPRHRLVDALNRILHRVPLLHRLLKFCVARPLLRYAAPTSRATPR